MEAEILLVEVGADIGLVFTRDFQSPARTIRETYLGLLSCRSSMSSRPSVSIMASTPYSAARSASEPDKTVSLPCVRARGGRETRYGRFRRGGRVRGSHSFAVASLFRVLGPGAQW